MTYSLFMAAGHGERSLSTLSHLFENFSFSATLNHSFFLAYAIHNLSTYWINLFISLLLILISFSIFNLDHKSSKMCNRLFFCIMIVYQIEFSMTGMDICGYERIKKPKWCGYSCFFGCYLCLPYEYSYYTVHFF